MFPGHGWEGVFFNGQRVLQSSEEGKEADGVLSFRFVSFQESSRHQTFIIVIIVTRQAGVLGQE